MLVLVLCYIIILFTNKITLVVYIISIAYLSLSLLLLLHKSKIIKKAYYTDGHVLNLVKIILKLNI